MKNKLLIALVTSLVFVGALGGTAFAWTYGLTGSGVCQENGSFKITWKVNNSTENQTLHITDSSNTSVVPVGSEVTANQTKDFYQIADGTKAGSFSLTLKGNWPGDQTKRERSASVYLREACHQPVVTPPQEGGRGGDTTPPVTGGQGSTATPAASSTQVTTTPSGAVNAGTGSTAVNVAALGGLSASMVGIGLGLRRIKADL